MSIPGDFVAHQKRYIDSLARNTWLKNIQLMNPRLPDPDSVLDSLSLYSGMGKRVNTALIRAGIVLL